jgi:SAM-dependent methyltransferase
MAFSTQWEAAYRQGGQNSTWPWSDLISYVMRYARPDGTPCRVLELGFGAGANVPFFLAIGADYYGTEGSATAVERVRGRFAAAKNFRVACCDFTESIPFEGPFDLVVDRSSLTHNGTHAIRKCLERLSRIMRPGGKLIGIDWFSTANADFVTGTQLEDRYTRGHFPAGQFRDVGTVHFSDEQHLLELLSGAGFQVQRLEHKRSDTVIPAGEGLMAWWHFLAVKP